MVDLVLKVNITKPRKDETVTPLKPAKTISEEQDNALMSQAKKQPSSLTGLYTGDYACDSQSASWNSATKRKIHVLKVFAGSALANAAR